MKSYDIPIDIFGYVCVKSCPEGIEIHENLEKYTGTKPCEYFDVIPWDLIVENCPTEVMKNEILWRERTEYSGGE